MGEGEHGPQGWGLGIIEICGGLEGPPGSPALNALGHRKGHGFLRGGRLSPAVGLRCPQSPGLGARLLGRAPPTPRLT